MRILKNIFQPKGIVKIMNFIKFEPLFVFAPKFKIVFKPKLKIKFKR